MAVTDEKTLHLATQPITTKLKEDTLEDIAAVYYRCCGVYECQVAGGRSMHLERREADEADVVIELEFR